MGIFSEKKDVKTIDTPYLRIKDDLIYMNGGINNTSVSINNISYISTEPLELEEFPTIWALVALVGLFFVWKRISVLVGILIMLLSLGVIYYKWYKKNKELKGQKRLNIVVNSGKIFSLIVLDAGFLKEVLEVIENSMNNAYKENYTINIDRLGEKIEIRDSFNNNVGSLNNALNN